MKKYIFLFSMFLSMVLASCTVSKSVISQDTDLTKYKYVTVIDNDTYRMPPELVQYQIQLYDAVGQSGLTMVSQYRMGDLTQEEQSALLIAKFGVSARQEETVVTVNFIVLILRLDSAQMLILRELSDVWVNRFQRLLIDKR